MLIFLLIIFYLTIFYVTYLLFPKERIFRYFSIIKRIFLDKKKFKELYEQYK